jgi:hypothetical protein
MCRDTDNKRRGGQKAAPPVISLPHSYRTRRGRRPGAPHPHVPASPVKGRGTASRRWWDSQSPALCGARLSRHCREAIWEGQQRVSPPNLPSCLVSLRRGRRPRRPAYPSRLSLPCQREGDRPQAVVGFTPPPGTAAAAHSVLHQIHAAFVLTSSRTVPSSPAIFSAAERAAFFMFSPAAPSKYLSQNRAAHSALLRLSAQP